MAAYGMCFTSWFYILFSLYVGGLGETCSYCSTKNADKTTEEWNYVNVRPKAYMFWWLYYTTAQEGFQNRPLVIWLQGGPGGSSTGFGNFQEIGPLDVNLNPRESTWLSEVSLLFIDNPVGTGYSYVTDYDAMTTDVAMIAEDLVTVLKAYMKQIPIFTTIPLYIFSESYGGKMTAAFSWRLYQAIQNKEIACNFKGLAMGDSWISPLDSTLSWAPYLYATSLVDETGLHSINKTAQLAKLAFESGQFKESTAYWSQTEDVLEKMSGGVNFYNIMKWNSEERSDKFKSLFKDPMYIRNLAPLHTDDLSELMNGPIRKKLKIIPNNVTWGAQSGMVFEKQKVEFMKPVVDIVDRLLNETDLSVVVYSGQLDLICDVLGTEKWIQRLRWPGLAGYNLEVRKKISNTHGAPLAFVKKFKTFSVYWILSAGHMVPSDAPDAALKMLKDVTMGHV